MLPEQLNGVVENYAVRVGGMDRVAGHDCQVIVLEPRDKLRYGHHFCAEAVSGLPLRAHTFSEKNEPLETFVFTELKIGGSFNRDKVEITLCREKPRLEGGPLGDSRTAEIAC